MIFERADPAGNIGYSVYYTMEEVEMKESTSTLLVQYIDITGESSERIHCRFLFVFVFPSLFLSLYPSPCFSEFNKWNLKGI